MKRTINARLAAILLFVSALGGGIVLLAHAGQVRRHARTLMAQARQAEAEGRREHALRYLQRYLEFAPGDNAARAHCGELVEQLASSDHEYWHAVDVYEQVLYREPSRRDIRRRLARLTFRLGWWSEAQNHLQILLRQQPRQGDLEGMLAQCQEASGEYALAAASYQAALRDDPQQVDAYVRLANLCKSHLDQPEKVGRVFDDLVRHNTQSVEAHLLRAAYHVRQAALAQAGRDIDCARELAPHDARVMLLSADIARRQERFDEARCTLQKGCQQQPNNLALQLTLADLDLQTDHKREALARLQKAQLSLPNQPELLLVLAETHLDLGEEAAVEQMIEQSRHRGAPPGLTAYLKGRLLLHRKQWRLALKTLEDVAESKEAARAIVSRANLILARCWEQADDRPRQLAALQKAVELDPSYAPAKIALARTLQSRGRIEEALEQMREVVQLPHAPDHAWIDLARLMLQRNRSLTPRKRSWTEIEKVLDYAGKLPTVEGPLLVLRAEVLQERGQAGEARRLLEKAAVNHSAQPGLWAALADLAVGQDNSDQALTLLEQMRSRMGNSKELLGATIALACRQTPQQACQTLRKIETALDRLPTEEQSDLLEQMAGLCFRIGEQEEGRRFCRLLLHRAPTDLTSHQHLLDLASREGEEALLADIAADLHRLEGEEGTWWRYGEALHLLLKSQHGYPQARESARELAADLARRCPDWPRLALLQAYLHELDAKPEAAANAYLRAYRDGERQPGLTERLSQLLAEQGRLDEADEIIRTLQQQEPLPAELARLGTEIALRQRHHERAQELAHLAVPKETTDYARLLWLGQALAQAGQPSEGEEMLRRSISLRSDLAETWLALIAHLAKLDQRREAEGVQEQMRRNLPVEQVPLALAIAAELLDQWNIAAEQYARALAKAPQDVLVVQRAAQFYLRLNRHQQAEPLLRLLIAPKTDAPAMNRNWARRQLALSLAFAHPEAIGEATALLQQNPKTHLDDRARLLVQATQPAQRRETLRLLEKAGNVQPLTPEELSCLVQLYDADKAEDTAGERMLDLLALDRNNPEYLACHIDRLLRRGRRDEARPWIKRLGQIEPDSPRVQGYAAAVRKTATKK